MRLFVFILGFLLTTTATHVCALEASFFGKISTGIIDYKRETSFLYTLSSEPIAQEYSNSLPFLGLGGTVAFDRFYLDLNGEVTTEGKDNNVPIYPDTTPAPFSSKAILSNRFSLENYNLTFGYNLNSRFSLIAGYRYSTIDLDTNPVGQIFNEDTGELVLDERRGIAKYKTTYTGPFIGAAYIWPIGSGALSFNLALGRFEAENDEEVFIPATSFTPEVRSNQSYSIGDTTGLAYGLSWNAAFNQRLSYSIGLNGYRYEFDAKEPEAGTVFLGSSAYDSTEQQLALRFTLRYRFR